MEATRKFVYTTDNTFCGFTGYEGKHLQSGIFITNTGVRLLLPKFGKSLLSTGGEIIFVHSWAQVCVTDAIYNEGKDVVRARMCMCYSRFLDSYELEEPEGHYHREGSLEYRFDGETYTIPCRITWRLDPEAGIFKCTLGANAYELTQKEIDLLNKIKDLMKS